MLQDGYVATFFFFSKTIISIIILLSQTSKSGDWIVSSAFLSFLICLYKKAWN